MKLTEEQLVENWEKLIHIIETEFDGDRKEKLLKMYRHFEERIVLMPASGRDYYHSAYPGGYVVHVLNVIDYALSLHEMYIEKNGEEPFYSREELVFCALNHDLGKVGDLEHEYFITHNEKWKKERGELYIHNPLIRNMSVPDRSLWLLQQFDIKTSQAEMIAIKIHDGMYDEGNKFYYVVFSEEKQLRDELPYILHLADMMATLIEKNQWKRGETSSKISKPKTKSKISNSAEAVKKISKNFFD